jgi:hypothetical protein
MPRKLKSFGSHCDVGARYCFEYLADKSLNDASVMQLAHVPLGI